MTEGKATTPQTLLRRGQPVRLHVQLGLRVAQGHGVLHARATCPGGRRGLDRRLPTLGTGEYEWQRLPDASDEHPHDVGGPGRPAAELEQPVGAGLHARRRRALRLGPARRAVRPVPAARSRLTDDVERHEPRRDRGRPLAGVAGGQPGAAHRRRRRTRATQQVVDLLDDWVRRDAPRLDADNDGIYDEAGPTIMDDALAPDRRGGDAAACSATCSATLERRPRPRRPRRRVLRRQGPAHAARRPACAGKFNLRYCGKGSLERVPRLALGRARRGRRAARDRSSATRIRRPGCRPATATGFAARA